MGKKKSFEQCLIICQKCKKDFYVNFYRRNTAKFCSKECYKNKSEYFLICKKCKKKIRRTLWQKKSYVGSYCSRKCYDNRKEKIFVKCDGCGKRIKIFHSQKKYYASHYCSNKCRINFGPIGRLTDENIVDNNYHRFVRSVRHCKRYYEWRNNVREKDKNQCVICNGKNNLTVHHRYVAMYDFIKKYGFNKELIYEDKMFFDINNGQLLCRSCHAKEYRKEDCRR